jgi:hypothetical protein
VSENDADPLPSEIEALLADAINPPIQEQLESKVRYGLKRLGPICADCRFAPKPWKAPTNAVM